MSWLAPILVLGLVILVHELGHFWAAKAFGVYAPRFSIGFGPALWRRRWGETEFVLAAIPLGGYVRMATRDDEATSRLEGRLDESAAGKRAALDPSAMIPFGPRPVPPERWFESKPLWQRLIILLAGVAMNVVLAVLVLGGVFAGFGRPHIRPVADFVVDTMPAGRAGVRPGDSIVSVNGMPVRAWGDVVNVIVESADREVRLGVSRGGVPLEFVMTPVATTDTNVITGEPVRVGRIGVQAPTAVRVRVPVGEAAVMGVRSTWQMGVSVLRVLRGLVTGRIGVNQLGGPVQIARSSVAAAQSGAETLLVMIAFLSVNLAILNLIPIPLLDGGQLVLQTAEAVKGRPFSDRAREWYARIGLAAIAALLLVVTFNDIRRLVIAWMS